MSKILEGMSKTNVNEGPAGAVIGGAGGYWVPELYNLGAQKTGILPTVDPKANEFGVPLDTITGVTGSVMGHNTQKNRQAQRDANLIAAAIQQHQKQQQVNAASSTPSAPVTSPTTPPKVGSTKQAAVSAAKKIPDIIASAPTKKIALATLAAYAANKGLGALTGKSLVDRASALWDKKDDIKQGATDIASGVKDKVSGFISGIGQSNSPSTPVPGQGNQTNPNVDCKPDAYGRLPAGCGRPALENAPDILKGMFIAEESFKAKLLKGAGKGYDWMHDLYLKGLGQTTKKDVDDWYQQYGGQTASPILKPGSDFTKGEPISFMDKKKWDELPKAKQEELLDKISKTKTSRRTLAGLTASGIVGGVGGSMYKGIETAIDQTDKKTDKETEPKKEPKKENPPKPNLDGIGQLGPKVPDTPVPDVQSPKPDVSDSGTPSNSEPKDGMCVVGGDILDVSPEDCDALKKMNSEEIKESVDGLIKQIAVANKIRDPNLIRTGQRLTLPGNLSYTVKSGDNLTKIAKALLNKAVSSDSEPMQTFTISTPRPSQKYPDSGLKPGEQFVDPRNNPGNLRFYKNLNQPGYVLDKAIGVDKNGFAVFATPEDGLDAMRRQIAIDARKGLTGREFIAKYAPAADRNDPEIYTKNVFGELGLDPDQPLDPSLIPLIQPLMIRQEHGKEGMYYYMPQTDPRNKVANLTEMEILQRFLDKQLNKNQKPVANPNAVPKKPTEPKEPGTTDYSKERELDPSFPSKHPLELERSKVDAEVQQRMKQLQKQKTVPENKFDVAKKVIGTGRYVVFNPSTGLRLQTNDVNKAVNAAQLMAKKDLDRPTMVYDTQTKFPVAAYRGSEDMYVQKNIKHESKSYKNK